MMKTAAALLTLALVGYVWCCHSDGDCSPTECCFNQNFLITSKRQLNSFLPSNQGTCKRKGGKGESCAAYYTCGTCQDGLDCILDKPLSVSPIKTKRRVAYIPATCQTRNNRAPGAIHK